MEAIVIQLAEGLAYDPNGHILVIDGIQVSPELIKAAFTAEGQRRHVIFESDGSVTFLTSIRRGDCVTFTRYVAPEPPRWALAPVVTPLTEAGS